MKTHGAVQRASGAEVQETNQRASRRTTDTLNGLLNAYEDSADFRTLADATKRGYRAHLRAIAVEFGDFPIEALKDRRSRGEFLAWRDRIALTSRRNADYRFSVFARVLSRAYNRGLAPLNPLERPGGSIAQRARGMSGQLMTKPPSLRRPRRTCISR